MYGYRTSKKKTIRACLGWMPLADCYLGLSRLDALNVHGYEHSGLLLQRVDLGVNTSYQSDLSAHVSSIKLATIGRMFYLYLMVSENRINPILIQVYPRKWGWPDLPHSTSNLSNSHSPSRSIHGILLLQTNTLALLHLCPPKSIFLIIC